MKISQINKKLIDSILEKALKEKEKRGIRAVLIDFKGLYKLLNKKEINFCKSLLKINPQGFGFKGNFFGIKPVPKNLIAIKGQKYTEKNKIKKIKPQYISQGVYKHYKQLNQTIFKDLHKKILIDSCYRSSAYQLIIFLYYLNFHKYNFEKIAKKVALPGYSEHGDGLNPAIDFITKNGKPSDEKPLDFLQTKEYKWLLKNASRFGFYLSYPKNNKLGVVFEPWHWRLKQS